MIPVYVLLSHLVLLGISLAFLAGDVLSHPHHRQAQVSSGGVRLLISTSRRHQQHQHLQQHLHHLPSLPLTRLRTRPLYLSRLSLMT